MTDDPEADAMADDDFDEECGRCEGPLSEDDTAMDRYFGLICRKCKREIEERTT